MGTKTVDWVDVENGLLVETEGGEKGTALAGIFEKLEEAMEGKG